MNKNNNISAIIITYNCSITLEETLKSVRWCDEIVVVDSGSTDQTEAICRTYGCKFFYNEFQGFGLQKQVATNYASNDWVLSIDSDEVIPPALQNEMQAAFSKTEIPYAGFYVPISLVFMGRVFKYGKEANSPRLRLFNRNFGRFNDSSIHEKVQIKGPAGRFKNAMLHYSHRDTEHFFDKFNRYSTIAAYQAIKNHKKTNKLFLVAKLIATFIIAYFWWLNFLNGFPGFVWSVYTAFYGFVKYLKIYELHYHRKI